MPANATQRPVFDQVDRKPYQLTAQASKGNAFCWMSWEPQIRWSAAQAVEDMKNNRNRVLEEKRAAGIDPLHMFGLHKVIAMDPKRFSVHAKAESSDTTSKTETLRNALQRLGPQTAAELTVVANLPDSGKVGALLHHECTKGNVKREGGKYHWIGAANA